MPNNFTDRAPVILAGATGNLGSRIAIALLDRGAAVRALVRSDSDPGAVEKLRRKGAMIAAVDFDSVPALTTACAGGTVVVSALAGLRDVIVDTQSRLLDAAIQAGVPRFIPSDYCIDFTKQPDGLNRNLDLRREFHLTLDVAPIAATSILNGAFTDMLTGQAPIVLKRFKRVLYWGSPDQMMDFTTIDDTAAFTASAALDSRTPRFLRIAGDRINARGLVGIAREITGERYRLFRAGGLRRLERMIRVIRALFPGKDELYPPWQGMQYLHNMSTGRARLDPLDNDRYPGLRWTTARDVLAGWLTRVR